MRPSRYAAIPLLLALAGPAPAQPQPANPVAAQGLHERLRQDFKACRHPSMALSPYRSYDPHRDLLGELRAMLDAPAEACPETPARAVAFLAAAAGDPIRPDADIDLLVMLEAALREGKGGPPDPARLRILSRHLWLVAGKREVPGLSEPELRAWVAGPEAVALLEARIAAAPTARAVDLRAGQLVDRTRADYDPARAADLLESGPGKHEREVRLRLAELLSDGSHLPPDFARAARQFRDEATGVSERAEAQRVLLRIGRRAAAAARRQTDRLGVLAILAPAALDGIEDSRALYARHLARVRAPLLAAPLPADRIEWVHAELNFAFAYMLDMLPKGTPPSSRPIVHEGLIGPDGRLVTVRLVSSSGVAARDLAVRSAWLRRGVVVDLSSVARGKAVWTSLPPVDPMFDYGAAWDHRKSRCPACS